MLKKEKNTFYPFNQKENKMKPKQPVKRILNKTPSTGKPKELDCEKDTIETWKVDLSRLLYSFKEDRPDGKTGEYGNYHTIEKLVSNTLTQQRTELLDKGKKYEFTRKEIIGWLHDQNWKCQELESILLQKRNLK
jgi:hypothetical protein